MGFTSDSVGKEYALSKEVFDTNRKRCLKESNLFINNNSEQIFGTKIIKTTTNKAFMGFANTLLQNYGLCIRSDRKSTRDKKTKKIDPIYFYYLEYIENINKYL
jgi:hypothetical protein